MPRAVQRSGRSSPATTTSARSASQARRSAGVDSARNTVGRGGAFRKRVASGRIWPEAVMTAQSGTSAWPRARALHQGNLGFEGGLAVALAASPLRELIGLSARDVHPPLYYLALAVWWRLAGPGVAAALWPSLALGSIAIAAAWRLGRRLG